MGEPEKKEGVVRQFSIYQKDGIRDAIKIYKQEYRHQRKNRRAHLSLHVCDKKLKLPLGGEGDAH